MIPGSTEYFFPRVSSDGRLLLAQHSGDLSLYLYEFASKKWRQLAKVQASYPSWSHDGKYVYFRGGSTDNPAIFRTAVPSGIVEKVASLAGVDRGPYFMGDWVGLDPTDAPIAVRNSTIEDIYWRIYRVHTFAQTPRIFTLSPPLDGALHLGLRPTRHHFER